MRLIRFLPGDKCEPDAREKIRGVDYLGVIEEDCCPARREVMDLSKFLNLSVILSAVRWLMTVWGSSEFVTGYCTSVNNCSWEAITGGIIALVALAWSYLVHRSKA